MATKTKSPTIKELNYKQAKDLSKKLSRDYEDYDAVSFLFGLASAGAVGLIISYSGTIYLRNLSRKLEDIVDEMSENDTLIITTKWKYVNHGKNNGFVPDGYPIFSIK